MSLSCSARFAKLHATIQRHRTQVLGSVHFPYHSSNVQMLSGLKLCCWLPMVISENQQSAMIALVNLQAARFEVSPSNRLVCELNACVNNFGLGVTTCSVHKHAIVRHRYAGLEFWVPQICC